MLKGKRTNLLLFLLLYVKNTCGFSHERFKYYNINDKILVLNKYHIYTTNMKRNTKENHFKEVYETYHNLVMKIANTIVHDYVLAQDICQDVFIKYYENGMKVDETFLKSWFIMNTRSKAIDYLRKSYQKHEMVDIFDPDKTDKVEPSEADELIDNIILKDMTCRFLYDLEKHNEDWYKIVVGVIIENRSEKEMANELHMSPGNLRVKLHRAKVWIRENYKDEYEDL